MNEIAPRRVATVAFVPIERRQHPRWFVRLDELDAAARQHHGVVTRSMTGLSDQAWRRAIRNGTLVRLYPGVARPVGTGDSVEQRIIAAVLAVGRGAMASHRSSAYLWGAPRPADDPIDVIVTRRQGIRSPPGVHVHRPRDTIHLSPQRQMNIRCTNVVRTLCDLGAVDPAGVVDAVGHALGARLLSLGTLEVALHTHGRPGRRGIAALRAAVDTWAIDTPPADSVLERAMDALVSRYSLPPVEFHKVIEGWEVDFWVIGTPVVLECDGWASHGLQRRQFERDRQRDAELTAAGWIVVRFTYRAITRTPAKTAERIRSVLQRWQRIDPPPAG